MRAFFPNGMEKMHISRVIEGLPILLTLSVFLFFAGPVVFLFNVTGGTGQAPGTKHVLVGVYCRSRPREQTKERKQLPNLDHIWSQLGRLVVMQVVMRSTL